MSTSAIAKHKLKPPTPSQIMKDVLACRDDFSYMLLHHGFLTTGYFAMLCQPKFKEKLVAHMSDKDKQRGRDRPGLLGVLKPSNLYLDLKQTEDFIPVPEIASFNHPLQVFEMGDKPWRCGFSAPHVSLLQREYPDAVFAYDFYHTPSRIEAFTNFTLYRAEDCGGSRQVYGALVQVGF